MIRAIVAKELRILFSSPLAWVLLAFLQVVSALMFLYGLEVYLEMQMQFAGDPNTPGATESVVTPVFRTAVFLMLIVVPLLTMRLIAEERRNQTLTFLISAPVPIVQIVLGKMLALMALVAIPTLLMALMGLSLLAGGSIDWGLLAVNTLGLLLLCATFSAIGLYLSCLTAQPVVAALGTYAVLLILWLIDIGASDPDSVLHLVAILRRFESFTRGIVSLQDAAYYAVMTVLFVGLAVRRLDGDRVRA